VRFRRLVCVEAAVVAALLLAACGGGGVNGPPPLPPSSATPIAHKERTLTAAEYPAMRDWIIADGSSSSTVRPVCAELEAARQTPVIRATDNACDRVLSILIDEERVIAGIRVDAASNCAVGDYKCGAGLLRGLRPDVVEIHEVFAAYYRDIDAAMTPGPCRSALTPPAALALAAHEVTAFDIAVDEYGQGDTQPLAALENALNASQGFADPTPCRPTPDD
jgi:hypothetical protein